MIQTRFAVLFCLLSMLTSLSTWAQSNAKDQAAPTSPVISLEEREKAKKRLYPGGRDEEALQVQAQLASPGRGGQVAEPEEPHADHD